MSLPSPARTRSTSPTASLHTADDTSPFDANALVAPEEQSELADARRAWLKMPFWKRPAPWWLMTLIPLRTVIVSLTLGAQVELYTDLVCRVYQPAVESLPIFSPSSLSFDYSPSFNTIGDSNTNNETSTAVFFSSDVEVTAEFGPCSSSSTVQAVAANLITATTTATGILTFLTVGWWGSLSDRVGRVPTLAIVSVGNVIAGLILVLVAKYVELLPGGYWFLLVEAVFAGAVGGLPSETAVIFGYLSDISTAEERSRTFSVVYGFMLAGLGLGPVLGSFVVRKTHSLIAVFYVGTALRVIYLCLIWFILPESRTTAQMEKSSAKHHAVNLDADGAPSSRFQRLSFFWKPLSVLMPEQSPKGGRRDWNLTLLVLSYGVMLLAASSLINQLLYAIYTFEWDAEYLGYCVSSIGLTRAAVLTLILPLVMKVVKKRTQRQNIPIDRSPEREPLLSNREPGVKDTVPKFYIFDLRLARFSVLVDAVTYAIQPFAPTGIIFLLFTSLGSFGAGLAPAVNSVALELYTRRLGKGATVESGKLFAAIGVVQAVFGHVLGPPMYGFIYAATVASYPRTIFYVALGNSVVSLVLLAFVRVAPNIEDVEDVA
ncbi:major facilitator superfamily domain-containing protein [Mycena filopes]|nr:major facilitator superfamily domain-containing protein [Mycena filopes]